MLLRLLPRDLIIADRAAVADTFSKRFTGLIGRARLEDGEALCIPGCSMVHMFWMRFAIDILFLAPDGTVIAVQENLRPWRISKHVGSAREVIELPAGSVARHAVTAGDRIEKAA